jgi:GntR family transcriptional repressor for pyruvate dehydrogenase complex
MFEPIKTEKLYNLIMSRITDLIQERKLVSGDKLPPERELAQALSVSRTSIREAMVALAAKGIITMRHGDGNYVSGIDANPHTLELFSQFLAGYQIKPDEILEVRIMLECESARLCARRADDEHLRLLRSLLERTRMQNGDDDSLSNMNKDLHSAIIRGAQNNALLRIMDVVWDIMNGNMWPVLKQESNNRKRQIELHLDQHEMIVAAVCARDAEGACKEMYNHLVTIEQEMIDLINKPLPLKKTKAGLLALT